MIKLEPFAESDFDTLISWATSEEVLVQFAGRLFSFPLTHQQLHTYLQDKNKFIYKVADASTTKSIGHAEIYLPGTETAVLGRIIIGNADYRGKGLCHQIINALLRITFTQFTVEKAELNVFDWNECAIKCYQRAGFTMNPGKTKERTVNGKTWIALNMTIEKINLKNDQ